MQKSFLASVNTILIIVSSPHLMATLTLEKCRLPGNKTSVSFILGELRMTTLSNPSMTLNMHSPILFPCSPEQGDPFTTVNLEGQYSLQCIAGDG